MEQVVQVAGALLILAAFAGAQLERMRPDAPVYLGLNLVGSLTLGVLAVVEVQWGFLLLESVWAAISAWGLVATLRS